MGGGCVEEIGGAAGERGCVPRLMERGGRMEIKAVAECVQDEEAAVMLREWGCDYIQGRLIGLASPQRPWSVPDETVLPVAG